MNEKTPADETRAFQNTAPTDTPSVAEHLVIEALAIRGLGALVIGATDIGTHAIEYALRHWPVFPLSGKTPAVPNPHPSGSRERQTCKGGCGKQGHGVLDATTDLGTIVTWWAGRFAGYNIGVRVPEPMMVLDIDVYHGGQQSWAKLVRDNGDVPHCLTTISGHGDGSRHLFMRRPSGKLSTGRLGQGIDLKTHTGYVVAPPSIHPHTGNPYVRVDGPVITPPRWLVALLREPARQGQSTQLRPAQFDGPSVAEQFNSATTWVDVLGPHGWACLDADPDADGARWLHPTHTSSCSATVRDGRLYIYSTSTAFEVTEAGSARGYSKFDAYALLEHHGDMKAAARQLRSKGAA